jgi:hypothetical protein
MGCGAFAGAVTGIVIGLHEGLRLLYAWNGYDFPVLHLIVVAGIALGLTVVIALGFGAVEWLLRRVLPFFDTKGRAADEETNSRYCSPSVHEVVSSSEMDLTHTFSSATSGVPWKVGLAEFPSRLASFGARMRADQRERETASATWRPWLGGFLGAVAGVLVPVAFWNDAADVILLLVLPPPMAAIGAACGAVTKQRRWPLCFITFSMVAGLLFWWWMDWVAYIDKGAGGMIPKFKLAPVEQFAFSTFIAALLGGVMTGVALVAWRLRRGNKS